MNSSLTMITMTLLQPKSRGHIKLNKCDDCAEANTVHSNYLSDPADRLTLLNGIKQQYRTMRSPAFQKLQSQLVRPPLPECDSLAFPSNDYWLCYIKYVSTSGSHMAGTGKCGKDSTSIVDPELKVYKTQNLRQIDAGM